MILWLDHYLFGNGHGIKTPYHDERYYWLVDTHGGERDGRNGQLYHWIGGLGAQLSSFQWRHPKPGETRRLAGQNFKPFSSYRHGPRVYVSWAMYLPRDLDEARAFLRATKQSLGDN